MCRSDSSTMEPVDSMCMADSGENEHVGLLNCSLLFFNLFEVCLNCLSDYLHVAQHKTNYP